MSSKNAKTAGVSSGVATAGGIGAYASTLSAAEMTAILATIGGGTMAGGLAVVAVAPVAIGAVASSLWKRVFD